MSNIIHSIQLNQNNNNLLNQYDISQVRQEQQIQDQEIEDDESELLDDSLVEREIEDQDLENYRQFHPLEDEQSRGLKYSCPETGSHFEFPDVVQRMKMLIPMRQKLDEIWFKIEQVDVSYSRNNQQQQQTQHLGKRISQISNLIDSMEASPIKIKEMLEFNSRKSSIPQQKLQEKKFVLERNSKPDLRKLTQKNQEQQVKQTKINENIEHILGAYSQINNNDQMIYKTQQQQVQERQSCPDDKVQQNYSLFVINYFNSAAPPIQVVQSTANSFVNAGYASNRTSSMENNQKTNKYSSRARQNIQPDYPMKADVYVTHDTQSTTSNLKEDNGSYIFSNISSIGAIGKASTGTKQISGLMSQRKSFNQQSSKITSNHVKSPSLHLGNNYESPSHKIVLKKKHSYQRNNQINRSKEIMSSEILSSNHFQTLDNRQKKYQQNQRIPSFDIHAINQTYDQAPTGIGEIALPMNNPMLSFYMSNKPLKEEIIMNNRHQRNLSLGKSDESMAQSQAANIISKVGHIKNHSITGQNIEQIILNKRKNMQQIFGTNINQSSRNYQAETNPFYNEVVNSGYSMRKHQKQAEQLNVSRTKCNSMLQNQFQNIEQNILKVSNNMNGSPGMFKGDIQQIIGQQKKVLGIPMQIGQSRQIVQGRVPNNSSVRTKSYSKAIKY